MQADVGSRITTGGQPRAMERSQYGCDEAFAMDSGTMKNQQSAFCFIDWIGEDFSEAIQHIPQHRTDGSLYGCREDAKRFESHKRRARKRRVDDSMSTSDWRRTLNYFGERCGFCHKPAARLEAEHIKPLSRGGSHTASNVVPVCPPCNHRKGTLDLIGFLLSGGANG